MKTFVKYDNFWWEYIDGPLNNAKLRNKYFSLIGKNLYCYVNIENSEMVEADDYKDLNWEDTHVLNKDSRFGWVDRKGVFYGCDWRFHGAQAELVHKCDLATLEQKGWIHISIQSKDTQVINALFYGNYKNGVMPTEKQMDYLWTRNDVQLNQVMEAYDNGNRAKARIYEANFEK